MRKTIAFGLALGTCAASMTASAADDSKLFTLGAGLLGSAGGNFIGKPSDSGNSLYPGFAGATVGGGLMIDARFFEVVGLEVDFIQSSDEGSGTITINTVDHDITIGQSSLHIPVLFKATLPAGLVSPSVFIGPEFVFVGDATASAVLEVDAGQRFEATNDNYTALAFGVGFEFALPTPIVDIRIPLSLRGTYNGSISDKVAERQEALLPTPGSVGGFRYESNPEFQALLTLGVAAYF